MFELFTPEALTALVQVILIDLVLAGDNAIVIGLAAAGLPKGQRNKAILIGVGAADTSANYLRGSYNPAFGHCRTVALRAASCCCGSAGRCGVS